MVMMLRMLAGCVALDCFLTWNVRAEMIPLELWRARIGLFNCTVSCSSLSASNRSPSAVQVDPRRGTRRKKSFRICIPSDQALPTSPLTSSSLSSAPPYACIDSTCLFLLLNIAASSLLIIAVICQLLMTSGDIETNPGPRRRGENSFTIYLCDYNWFLPLCMLS